MNRLESINKELSANLNHMAETTLNAIYKYTLDFATEEGALSGDKTAEDIILNLKSNMTVPKEEIDYIEAQVEKHDQIYFDLEDEGEDDEATQEFVRARAFAAVMYLAKYRDASDIEMLREGIYEASVLLEDSATYFDEINRIIKM